MEIFAPEFLANNFIFLINFVYMFKTSSIFL